MPFPFDIDGGLLLALVRGATAAALLSLFGTLSFAAFVIPRAARTFSTGVAITIDRRLAVLSWVSLGLGVLSALLWLVFQSADMAGSMTPRQVWAALPDVTMGTSFGHTILLQLAALVATAVSLTFGRRRIAWAVAMAAIATALQAGHSHAASMYAGPNLLLASDVVHLWAAGAWLGGLLPLLIVVQAASPGAGATAARWFSPLGQLCLVAMTVTAAFQGWVMVASIPGLLGTGYGWMALVKLVLFGVLFAFAWVNRYRLAPALLRDRPARAKRLLVRSVGVQAMFGLAIVAAASVLSSLPPAMHEQAVWPFASRVTLDTVQEAPEFMAEMSWALASLGGSLILLAAAAALRRVWTGLRWGMAAVACLVAWFAVPHLGLLFVPAYPTSYFHSPTLFAATGIVQGAERFPDLCASCHGAAGRGDGPAAKGLPVPPADLTAAHLWMHSDGDLFWWLTHGIDAPEGGLAMPGFASALSPDDRWDMIDYIRANNAGLAFHATGQWPQPLQAPEFQAVCKDGRTVGLADLRGGFVRLVFGQGMAAPGVTTIVAGPARHPAPGLCVVSGDTVARAYAIVAGLSPAGMDGTEFLIDASGWLRAMQPPGAAPGWSDPAVLMAALRDLAAHPLADRAPMKINMQM